MTEATTRTIRSELDDFIQESLDTRNRFMGFQTSQKVVFPEALHPLLSMNLLNIGDPFEDDNFRLNAKKIERLVLDYYARLWHAPHPDCVGSKDSYWGYMTTMGSTEGNFCGLWRAREYLARCHGRRPVLLCSTDTHYSIVKAARILQIPFPNEVMPDSFEPPPPSFVPSNRAGQIDVESLEYWANHLLRLGFPLIFVLNHGSTFKGAFDPITDIVERSDVFRPPRRDRACWIHVDAAICGNTSPLLKQGHPGLPIPEFDFAIPEVCSIAASPYKWIGAPWPFGIFLMRSCLDSPAASTPNYVGSPDSTVSGSRNGLSSVLTWYYLSKRTTGELIQEAVDNERVASYAHKALAILGHRYAHKNVGFKVFERSRGSPVIYFGCPPDPLLKRFSLPMEMEPEGPISHIVVMPHVTKEKVDMFSGALKDWLECA